MRVQDILPVSIRRYLLKKYYNYLWPGYFKAYIKVIEAGRLPDEILIRKLVYAWGNQGYSAQINYIQTMLQHALQTSGDIVECGSGLSTLMVGVIAKKRNIQMSSFEHFPFWAHRVQKEIDLYNLSLNKLYITPLKSYGSFDWYDISNVEIANIGLCICDAPPGDTRGGRRGFLPLFLNKMLPNAVILIDDTSRQDEQNMIREWKNLCDFSVSFSGVIDPHAILILK